MEKQEWFCEVCRTHGEVEHETHADVLSVCHLIDDAHKSVSPHCSNSVRGLRIVNKCELVKELS